MRSTSDNKKRNTHATFKVKVRKKVPLGSGDDVLDAFAGDGEMYRRVWHKAGRGACCDIDSACVDRASKERAGWLVLEANCERAFRAALLRERAFSVVDMDCYGSPWRFVAAFFSRSRKLADPCHVVLTDNYAGHRNISAPDKTLDWQKPGTYEDYDRAVDALLVKLLEPRGLVYERRLFSSGKAVQHLLVLRVGS